MKKKSYILIFCLLKALSIYSQTSDDLLGKQDLDELIHNESFPWFDKEYQSYIADTNTIAQLASLNREMEFVIVAGTWCVDTRRELPRFFKIFDLVGYDKGKVSLIFVNRNKESPGKDERKIKAKRIPTFVIYSSQKEIGRITKKSMTTLEQDLLNILSK